MMFKKHTWKNVYSIGTYYSFESKISVRTVVSKEENSLHQLLNNNINFDLFDFNASDNALLIQMNHFDELPGDAFIVDTRKNTIEIKSSTIRGFIYGIHALNEIVTYQNNSIILPVLLIEDEPDFPIRGIIEGYYGTPWTFEERMEMFPFMVKHRLNTYMYGPKVDPYHRIEWRTPYPKEQLNIFKKMIDKANELYIDFWMCMSPAYHEKGSIPIDYASDDDKRLLFAKYQQFIDLGLTRFGLLYDDIDYALQGDSLQKYQRPGIAHALLANALLSFLKSKIDNPQLVICPTEYHEIGSSPYRDDLRLNLNKEIAVFWTGDNVVAEAISNQDIIRTKAAFDKPIYLWDNFPVSDFTYGVREFIGPIKNRTVDLKKHVDAYLINPSIHYQISKVGMITMARYAWNAGSYKPEESYLYALNCIDPLLTLYGKAFFNHNSPNPLDASKHIVDQELAKSFPSSAIIDYYMDVKKSADQLLSIESLFIDELRPWLLRTLKEVELIAKMSSNDVKKSEIIDFLQDIHFPGSELFDLILLDLKLLEEQEYKDLIITRRGRKWYRVFEAKRWQK